jgi:hypothetical protein
MGHRYREARRAGSTALKRSLRAALLCCGLLVIAPEAWAQSQLRAQCTAASRPQVQELCENIADATLILQPRVGMALSGGNPVPGTASTLGMRIGSLPRLGLGLRVTAVSIELPPVERVGQQENLRFPVGAISADATMGLFQGLPLLPTVGGFGSVDLLASAGVLPLPRGEGFDDEAAFSWAVGARVGVLRESFTAPGVSVDVLYRSLGDFAYGSEALTDRDAFLSVDNYRVVSVRGVVGKRLMGIGATGGVAWDRYRADVAARVVDPTLGNPDRVLSLSETGLTTSRTSLFANASLTLLILNLAIEGGWQQGGSVPAGASDLIGKGGLFGGIAVRLAI